MKKITCALLAGVAMASAAFADSSATGFYLGGSAGMGNTNTKYGYNNSTTDATNHPIVAANQQNHTAQGGAANPLFGLFAGYGIQNGKAYFGAELSGGIDTAKVVPFDDTATNATTAYWKTTVKRTAFLGLAARVGYFVTPSTLLYARLGLEASKFKATADASNMATETAVGNLTAQPLADQITADGRVLQATRSVSKNAISFAPGLGLEVYVSKNLFMRAEYSYVFGPSIKFSQNLAQKGAIFGTNVNHTLKMNQSQFKIGVGYKF